MKWLELSTHDFEPIPDIQFSFKKPLFAASVVLKYAKHGHGLHATAEVIAKIPIKGTLHYLIEAQSARIHGEVFSFSVVKESDVTGGNLREIHAKGSTLSIKKSSHAGAVKESIDIINISPVSILAHLFVLPAFRRARSSHTQIYAGHLVIGAKVQALRLERVSHAGEIESYEGKFIHVPHAMTEHEWHKLPWSAKKGFEFDWNVEHGSIIAARFHVPIIGKIEIKT